MHSRLFISLLIVCALLMFIKPLWAQSPEDAPSLAFEAVDLNGGQDLLLARAKLLDLAAYPIVPELPRRTWQIAQQGLRLGRDARAISKVGDCNSAEWRFLHPFGLEQFDLGEYDDLALTVAYFHDAFAQRSYAAHNGLTAFAVHDAIWSHPQICRSDETPLRCEYRVSNPAVAIIMFGTNDMLLLTPAQFDRGLRRAVFESIQAGIIPLLSTFPRHLGFPDKSLLYNKLVVRIALDFHVPLINLWLALEPLPDHGVAGDQFHLSGPLTLAADLSYPNLETGYPMRNLVTLQALDKVRREVLQPVYAAN